MHDADVIVVGGGLAGLSTAIELHSRGVDVLVLDAGSAPGGVARTVVRDGFEFDPAAGTLMLPHPHLSPTLARVGVEPIPAEAAGVRYVFTGGRMVAIPPSPAALFAPVAPLRARLAALGEPWRKPTGTPDESLSAFLGRRVGHGLGEVTGWVAASGVFAGDPDRLEARSAFPALVGLEELGGSLIKGLIARRKASGGAPRPRSHVPGPGGMTGVTKAIAAVLGERYRPRARVGGIRHEGGRWVVEAPGPCSARELVLAVGPSQAAGLLEGDLGRLLGGRPSAPVVSVGIGASDLELPPGFGVLTGPDAGTDTLGILFESSYAPHRAPAGSGLVKVIAGGATNPGLADETDDVIVDRVTGDIEVILSQSPTPTFVEVVRNEIPQYDRGHAAWMSRVEAATPAGLHLTGWGYRGVGASHVATDAARIAAAIATRPSG